ncbi:MAG: hypothetical protein EXS68_02295 [Candidatus Ryanbacteria bacterium]|nr:hypothetical protein [Candidatus Ryanbacteria bacterium]
MKKKLWFRAKDYGWGWQPSSWEGWLIIVAYIMGMFFIFWRIDTDSHSASDTLINFIPQSIILTAILIWTASAFGERPEWRWAGRRMPARVVLFKSVILVAVFTVFTIILMVVLNALGLVVSK